jgi:hypothetical protein
MPQDQSALPVSLYCVWQWWEEHYQRVRGRPNAIDLDWLDATYLGRERFLYERLGQFGLGQAEPALDRDYLSKVMPFYFFMVPMLLGLRVHAQQVGGYAWDNLTTPQLRRLEPVDIAQTALAEHIARERERKLAHYGTVTQMLDLGGSVSNNAFEMRGPEFYADLLADPGLAHHYLGVIAETMGLAYRWVHDLFGPTEAFPLGNCNVSMMSPELYMERVREYDIRCVAYAAQVESRPPCCDLHHCNVKAEPFAQAYSAIPGLRSLQASHLSDIRRLHEILPQVAFSAMINPVELLTKPAAQLAQEIGRCLAEGANDLVIWDIDPAFGPDRLATLCTHIAQAAERQGRKAVFSAMPIAWEEMDWQFPRYRGDRVYSLQHLAGTSRP